MKKGRQDDMQGSGYDCIFSVVMAIYNCEPFLREALDSVLLQERFSHIENGEQPGKPLRFEEICEVIMVDDGSTDLSGKICDEYAEKHPNFKVIHKKNGGVASARNAGVALARGKYVNFLDGDDKFSKNVFCEVYSFFEKNYEKTDVVTVPLRFFDAIEGEHWQNYKFKETAEVVDLYENYDSPLMFVNASFFKSECKNRFKFNGKLVCGEDIRYVCEVIADKMTVGLVPTCTYFYRRRSLGEESLVQSTKKKYGWYFDYFEHLTEWGIDFCKRKFGFVPDYFQNILFCDLQWRFNNEYEATARALLGEEKYEEYKKRLWSVLQHFDDKIILGQRNLWSEHKHLILCKKHGTLPERQIYPDDVRLKFCGKHFYWLSACFTELEFISISKNTLTVEGRTVVFGYPNDTKYELFFELREDQKSEKLLHCEITDRQVSSYRLDEMLYLGIAFKFRMDISNIQNASLALVMFADGEKIVKKRVRFGKFSPIGSEFSASYYTSEGYLVTRDGYFLNVKKASANELKIQKRAFLAELWKSESIEMRKAFFALQAVYILNKFKSKPLVLISDRTNRAEDNGEALFRFLCKERIDDFRFVFSVSKYSPDYKRLKKYGSVADSEGRLCKLLHLLADCIVSSHADEHTTNPFDNRFSAYRNILSERKYVFLQHGITKDDASEWLGRFNKNISGIVCAGKEEAKTFESSKYQYSSNNVWKTGFPRFDRLYDDNKRYITVMPTWRMYLSVWDKSTPGIWKPKSGFTSSSYFKFYNRLLNDEKLIFETKKQGYRLCFMPHPNVSGALDLFNHHRDVTFFDEAKSYRDVFAESSLILTDYSSAVFDFAYLRKPIVYTQFDKDEFFSGYHAYKRGYFDYEKDGFGEVAYDYPSTVNLLLDYAYHGCRLKKKYEERIDNFFIHSDKNNSYRVYKAICKLLSEMG